MLSPCLFNLYAEHIMRNARLDELQAGIKIGRRNIDDLRDAYDTTLMAESEEEPKSLLMRVKEESGKAGLKLSVRREQDDRGAGGRGVHLSPWIHQGYTFRHRSACRTPAESGQEYLTSRKE